MEGWLTNNVDLVEAAAKKPAKKSDTETMSQGQLKKRIKQNSQRLEKMRGDLKVLNENKDPDAILLLSSIKEINRVLEALSLNDAEINKVNKVVAEIHNKPSFTPTGVKLFAYKIVGKDPHGKVKGELGKKIKAKIKNLKLDIENLQEEHKSDKRLYKEKFLTETKAHKKPDAKKPGEFRTKFKKLFHRPGIKERADKLASGQRRPRHIQRPR